MVQTNQTSWLIMMCSIHAIMHTELLHIIALAVCHIYFSTKEIRKHYATAVL